MMPDSKGKIENEQAWRFLLASMSNMSAACVTNPAEVIKTRMQLENELAKQKGISFLKDRYYDGFIKGGIRIVRDEGVRGLCKGLFPSLMRECSYSGIRMGAYEPLKVFLGATDPAHTPLWKKICAGATSGLYVRSTANIIYGREMLRKKEKPGAIGSSIATPTDLVRVRMQAQGKPSPGQSPRYKSTFAAFGEIIRQGGVRGLYVGVGPTVKRAAILTATQRCQVLTEKLLRQSYVRPRLVRAFKKFYGRHHELVKRYNRTVCQIIQDILATMSLGEIPSYDHTKHTILNAGWMSEGPVLHVVSSMIAGFTTALTTSPVDVVKTRIMNQKGSKGKLYKNAFDCFWKTLGSEGPLGLYKGFIPNWMRMGPHTIITFFIFEQLRKLVGIRPI